MGHRKIQGFRMLMWPHVHMENITAENILGMVVANSDVPATVSYHSLDTSFARGILYHGHEHPSFGLGC